MKGRPKSRGLETVMSPTELGSEALVLGKKSSLNRL